MDTNYLPVFFVAQEEQQGYLLLVPPGEGPASGACAAGLCAFAELRESFDELGHHHGVALLSLSHVAKALWTFDEVGVGEMAIVEDHRKDRASRNKWSEDDEHEFIIIRKY
jgi:hypothetical protein